MGDFKHHSVQISGGKLEDVKTNSDELEVRNGQESQRTFTPDSYFLLGSILDELKKMNKHLAMITDEEDINEHED